ncbi:MAG: efflux RND transporter periplasmic adaptor subunit, partial [Rubrivivax sp.]
GGSAAGTRARRRGHPGRGAAREGRVELGGGGPPTATLLAARFDNLREGAKVTVVAERAEAMASAAASTPTVR